MGFHHAELGQKLLEPFPIIAAAIGRFGDCGADDNSPYAQEPCEVESLKHGFVAEVRRETASPTVTGLFCKTLLNLNFTLLLIGGYIGG